MAAKSAAAKEEQGDSVRGRAASSNSRVWANLSLRKEKKEEGRRERRKDGGREGAREGLMEGWVPPLAICGLTPKMLFTVYKCRMILFLTIIHQEVRLRLID